MSKRGIRRMSMRVRVGVAAAVLVAGGAAGVAVVAGGGGGPVNAQSAAFNQHSGQWMSETSAISTSMNMWRNTNNSWNTSAGMTLTTMSHMQQMKNASTVNWHKKTLVFQRGTVSAISIKQKELVVTSANGTIDVWHWNGGTKAINVGAKVPGVSSSTAMMAMTGGTMKMPSWWHGRMNPKPTAATTGDTVFVFGEKVNGKLWAQLVLFAAPMTTTTATATATPTATASATATSTSTSTTTLNGQNVSFGNHS